MGTFDRSEWRFQMGHRKSLGLAFPALLMAVPVQSEPAPHAKASAEQELGTVDYFIGNWDCAHTVGTFSGTYKTSYTKVLGGRWLQQTYDFPAQKTSDRDDPEITAVALMGFDERRQAWVRFFANSLGQYFPIR